MNFSLLKKSDLLTLFFIICGAVLSYSFTDEARRPSILFMVVIEAVFIILWFFTLVIYRAYKAKMFSRSSQGEVLNARSPLPGSQDFLLLSDLPLWAKSYVSEKEKDDCFTGRCTLRGDVLIIAGKAVFFNGKRVYPDMEATTEEWTIDFKQIPVGAQKAIIRMYSNGNLVMKHWKDRLIFFDGQVYFNDKRVTGIVFGFGRH